MSQLPPTAAEKMDYSVVNAQEELVFGNVRKMMEYMDMCKCPKCFSDACAMVLNQLPPHYVTTRKGELLTQLPQMGVDKSTELSVKVVQALQMVKNSPKH